MIDLDATIITASSNKAGAAATFKKTYGFHPLAAWCANTEESLAMLLRSGNAGSNTVADHLTVLAEALRQVPGSPREDPHRDRRRRCHPRPAGPPRCPQHRPSHPLHLPRFLVLAALLVVVAGSRVPKAARSAGAAALDSAGATWTISG